MSQSSRRFSAESTAPLRTPTTDRRQATRPFGLRVPNLNGSDFDGPVSGRRELGRPFDRFIQVLAIQDVEAPELLLRFCERAIGGNRLTASDRCLDSWLLCKARRRYSLEPHALATPRARE